MAFVETFVSTDIETDGPIPGINSMLSIGSVAYTPQGRILGKYSAVLGQLEGAVEDAKTMKWWASQPNEAWLAAVRNPRPAEVVMKEYRDWLKSLSGRPVFVAYPAGFDFTFVYWYLIRFTGECPFSFSCLDMKTMAMVLMKNDSFHKTIKRKFPREWFGKTPHSHVALEDALEQGELFFNMRKAYLNE